MKPDKEHKLASPERPRISLCMIVRDEAAMLPGCLESVAGLADEIIVVDTGSADETAVIARARGARVIPFDWCDDFSAARNASLESATGEWILWLDADERLQPSEHDRVRDAIAGDCCDAYLVPILSPTPRGPQVTRGHRLFRNGRRIRFSGRVHEQIGPSFEQAGYRVGTLDIAIDHLGYNLSAEKQGQKDARNLRLLELARNEHPNDAYVRFTLAQCYMSEDRNEDAERELKAALGECRGVRLDRLLPPDIRASAQNNLASIALKRGTHPEALRRTRESVRILPDQMMAYLISYQVHHAQMNHREALEDLKAAKKFIEAPPSHGGAAIEPTVDRGDIERRMAECYLRLSRTADARSALRDILRAKPGDPRALAMLARCALAEDNPDEAWPMIERACSVAPDDDSLLDLAVFVLLKQGRLLDAAERLASLCSRRPGDVGLKRRLAGVLAKAGKTREAAEVMSSLSVPVHA